MWPTRNGLLIRDRPEVEIRLHPHGNQFCLINTKIEIKILIELTENQIAEPLRVDNGFYWKKVPF